MTTQNTLDLSSDLIAHPLAELLVEISHARLDGSLRISNGEQKVIVYFNKGTVVFAISNARAFRLFDILLREKKIDQQFLTANPTFTNDMEFARALIAKGVFTSDGIKEVFSQQISGILKAAIRWTSGDWTFSPLARLKETIRYEVDVNAILLEYVRTLSAEYVIKRFKSVNETFTLLGEIDQNAPLQPHEAFIVTRFTGEPLSVQQIMGISGMPEHVAFQALYTLWLSGFVARHGWNPAFTDHKLNDLRLAKLELKKEADHIVAPAPVKEAPKVETVAEEAAAEAETAEPELTVSDYIARSETAATHYEMLGIEIKAEASEVKQAYFALAKRLHPDHFHSEGDAPLLAKLQNAFTRLSQAYEALKTPESREAYDFKMRKELAEQEKRAASAATGASKEEIDRAALAEQASENFEQGFSLLMDEEFDAATPYLARAVFIAPNVPKYRSYYGKALSADDKQRHKAESEMQAAIKLDPTNPTFRLVLAEFFVQMNMIKRAEGELNRLLSSFPSNREARMLLDSLQKK